MLPTKRIQLKNANEDHLNKYSPKEDDASEDYDDLDNENNNQLKKQRKRRTLSETSKRDFVCGCGKKYVSYPAIYLHVQRKHNSEWPKDTIIPEKTIDQEKVKRGRPKVNFVLENNSCFSFVENYDYTTTNRNRS